MCLLGDKPFWDEFHELRQGLAPALPTGVKQGWLGVGRQGMATEQGRQRALGMEGT